MKKSRRGVAMDSDASALFESPTIRSRHQRLLQDYDELQNETEAMKEKMLFIKRKKSTLLDEVRFLRHRYEFLKNQSIETRPKHGLEQPRNLEIRPSSVKKGKSSQKYEASLKPLAQAHDSNQRGGGMYNGMVAASRKSRSVFLVNQKPRTCSEKEVAVYNSSLMLDRKERVYRVHEAAANRNTTPVFDLNRISIEEEEVQAGFEPSSTEEEPKNSVLRSVNEAKNSDLMISSVCRNVGNGSNRAGKRKISWQDQVALRA